MRQITESDSRIRTDRLPNGVRVVTEHMPVSKTASLGIWIEAGSRHEAPGQEGMAHLMEHMAFKGTARRECRSDMNITFRLPNEALEETFVKEASKQGLKGLKGHRSVGGIRASVYNACPVEGVEALATFMKEFARKNG